MACDLSPDEVVCLGHVDSEHQAGDERDEQCARKLQQQRGADSIDTLRRRNATQRDRMRMYLWNTF